MSGSTARVDAACDNEGDVNLTLMSALSSLSHVYGRVVLDQSIIQTAGVFHYK